MRAVQKESNLLILEDVPEMSHQMNGTLVTKYSKKLLVGGKPPPAVAPFSKDFTEKSIGLIHSNLERACQSKIIRYRYN